MRQFAQHLRTATTCPAIVATGGLPAGELALTLLHAHYHFATALQHLLCALEAGPFHPRAFTVVLTEAIQWAEQGALLLEKTLQGRYSRATEVPRRRMLEVTVAALQCTSLVSQRPRPCSPAFDVLQARFWALTPPSGQRAEQPSEPPRLPDRLVGRVSCPPGHPAAALLGQGDTPRR